MGTRNLTMVISGGKAKIAQYGQWDGYPGGQGLTALRFLHRCELDVFKNKLSKVRFATKKDQKERDEALAKLGSKNGWVTTEQSKKYDELFPFDSRDIAAEILQLVYETRLKEIVLIDKSSFASDSLFCEWCYVIDLDKNTFEIYEGFNKTPLSENDRFFYLQNEGEKYYPVKLKTEYSLFELPTEDKFLSDLKEEVEEDEMY